MTEIELFDGTILEFPDGTSQDVMDSVAKKETAARRGNQPTEQPAAPISDRSQAMRQRAQAAREGTLQANPETLERTGEINQNVEDRMALDEMGGLAGGMVMKAGQGLPFIGEWIDEGLNKIQPGSGDRLRRGQEAMSRLYPKTALGSEIAGGIIGSIPLAIGAIGTAGKAASRTGQVLRGAGLAGSGGAVEGAIAGGGRANDGDRQRGAQVGAAVGGGLGLLLGGFAPLAADGVSAWVKKVKKLDVSTIAEEFGISAPAARIVRNALLNDDLDAATARLGQLGDDAMLADSGAATGQLLNAASSTGGDALNVTRRAVTDRSDQIGARLPQRLDEILGKPVGVRAAAREIASSTAPARQAAYDRAYSIPVDYSGNGRAIEDVLERIPPRTLKSAIDEANEAMVEGGKRNLQIMAEIGDDGAVVFRKPPNVQQLDEIKKSLDAIGRESIDQFGRPTAQGARAKRLARELRDATAESVPEYKTALKLGGDKIKRDEALDIGRKLLFKGTTVEDVRELVEGGLSSEARDAARQGLRETIENTMSTVRRTISDPDVDAREAMALVKEVSNRANKKKLELVLGSAKANTLLDELDRTATALALRGAVARNSDTAIRQSIQGQVVAESTPGLLRRTLGKGGNPLDAAREVTESIAGIDPRSMNDLQKGYFDEIAQALTGIRGPAAERALQSVRRAMSGQPLKNAEADLIGRLAAGAGVGSLYQAASQSLQPR